MNENFKKRPSSQNTFFLSSGLLDELDNYLSDPQNRTSRILSLKNIPHPKDPPPNLKTANSTPFLEEMEDPEALLNFINIEETRKRNDVDEILRCEIKLEVECASNTYDMFPKIKEHTKKVKEETYKIEDTSQILQVNVFLEFFIRMFFFSSEIQEENHVRFEKQFVGEN